MEETAQQSNPQPSSSSPFDIGRLINRVKAIFLSPKAVWADIWAEELTLKDLLLAYFLPVAAASYICSFLGMVIFGIELPFIGTIKVSFLPALIHAIVQTAMSAVYIFLGSKIVSMLSKSFGGDVTEIDAAKVLAFSALPALASGILGIIPALSVLGILFGLFSLYVMYVGLAAAPNAPSNTILYMIVSLVVMLIVFAILGAVMYAILPSYYNAPDLSQSFGQGLSETLGNIKEDDAKKFLDTMQKLGEAASQGQ